LHFTSNENRWWIVFLAVPGNCDKEEKMKFGRLSKHEGITEVMLTREKVNANQ